MSGKSMGVQSKVLETLLSADVIGTLSNMADIGELLQIGDGYSPEEAGLLVKLQAERLAMMIDSLMMVEQINNGSIVPITRPVVLRPTLESVINGLDGLSKRYATRLKLGRSQKLRPILADDSLLGPIIRNALEAVIRTTVSKRVRIDAVSHDDRLFIHIQDKDASQGLSADNKTSTQSAVEHTIAIPSLYVARSLLTSINGELRVVAVNHRRHIDLIFPHSVQLSMEL